MAIFKSSSSLMTAVLTLVIFSIPAIFAYQTTVDIGAKECFFERLASADKLAIAYDVIDGGFRDLAFSLTAPEGGDLMSDDDDKSSGRYTFAAAETGEYRLCFDNGNTAGRRSYSPKVVKFAVEDLDNADRLSALYLAELQHRLKFVQYESEVAATAFYSHYQLSEQVNFFVTAWAVFELLLLMTTALIQIIYLRSLFVRRLRL